MLFERRAARFFSGQAVQHPCADAAKSYSVPVAPLDDKRQIITALIVKLCFICKRSSRRVVCHCLAYLRYFLPFAVIELDINGKRRRNAGHAGAAQLVEAAAFVVIFFRTVVVKSPNSTMLLFGDYIIQRFSPCSPTATIRPCVSIQSPRQYA